ncbi:uncharacterized protein LOC109204801 isoform X5 [Oreochromis niloticus]|uniref:uncharacterized protein LOC109204801 isoform X5 n=1 Tax=Oreochromis niloticus TaxID=8128 RepID=UPI000DF2E425|nr:uncharacterized protein LOC109204801 isoform X5 [Oreochromis niloticus]
MDTIFGVALTYVVENIFPQVASYIAKKALQRYTSAQASAQTEKNVRSNDDDEVTYESHGPSSIGFHSCSEMAQEKPEHRRKDSAISELKLSPCAPPRLTVRSIYALNKREWLNIEFLGSEKTKPFDSMGQARMASIYWAQEKTVTVVSTSRTTTDDDFSVYWSHERSTIIYSTARRGTVSNDMLPCLTDKPYDHVTSHLSEIQSTSVTHTLKLASESFKDEPEEKSETQPDSSNTGYWSMNDMAWENVENIFPHIASYIAEKALQQYTSAQASAQTEKNVRSNDDDEVTYESHGPSSIGLRSCSEMVQEKPEHRRKDSAISELRLSPCAPPRLTVRSIYALNKREWLNIEFLGSEKTKPFDSMGQARMASIYWAQEKTVTVVSTSRTTTDDDFSVYWSHERSTIIYSTARRGTVSNDMLPCLTDKPYDHGTSHLSEIQSTSVTHTLKPASESFKDELEEKSEPQPDSSNTGYWSMNDMAWENVEIPETQNGFIYSTPHSIGAGFQAARRRAEAAITWLGTTITAPIMIVIYMFYMLYQVFKNIAAPFVRTFYWARDRILVIFQEARRKFQMQQQNEAATMCAPLRFTVAAFTVIFMFYMFYPLFETPAGPFQTTACWASDWVLAVFQEARRKILLGQQIRTATLWPTLKITIAAFTVIIMFHILYQLFVNIAAAFQTTVYWATNRILAISQEAKRKNLMRQYTGTVTQWATLQITVAAFTVIFMFHMLYQLFVSIAAAFRTIVYWPIDWILAVIQAARRKIQIGQLIEAATTWATLRITVAAFTVIFMFHMLYQLFVSIAAAFRTIVYWPIDWILAVIQAARRKIQIGQLIEAATTWATLRITVAAYTVIFMFHMFNQLFEKVTAARRKSRIGQVIEAAKTWATLQITVAAFTVIFMFHMLYQLFVSIAAAFRTIVYWPIDWILAVIQAARRKIQIGQLIEAATTWATLRITVAAYTVIFMFHILYQLFVDVAAAFRTIVYWSIDWILAVVQAARRKIQI